MTTLDCQLAELLGDPDFRRVFSLVVYEIARVWTMSEASARAMALSAIGEPEDLEAVYKAWSDWKQGTRSLGYAKMVVRNLLINLLAQDARRAGHISLEDAFDPEDEPPVETPQRVLEDEELILGVHRELLEFAARGKVQAKRAELLRLRFLEGLSYRRLSRLLDCSENNLRNRVFKAAAAFHAHVRRYRPELTALR
jgi:RNA polymerase sigma factor (sigma-70 family)